MVVAVFPGQGSQRQGMGRHLYDHVPAAKEIFERVSAATGLDLPTICFKLDDETLRQTQNAQIALYTVGLAAFQALRSEPKSLPIGAFAGHSIGEYTALAAANALDVEDGARLVHIRGMLMAESGTERPGGMAAVLGMDRDNLASLCQSVSSIGTVVIANDNAPGQLVISGDLDAVQAVSAQATEHGAKRVVPLNVSGAFHSPLMLDAAKQMRQALDKVRFRPSSAPIYCNVTSEPVLNPEAWPEILEQQLYKPVLWTAEVSNMLRDGATRFVEFGSGEVLSGLIKRIHQSVQKGEEKVLRIAQVVDSSTLAAAIEDLSQVDL